MLQISAEPDGLQKTIFIPRTESQITNYTDVSEIKEQLNTFETTFK